MEFYFSGVILKRLSTERAKQYNEISALNLLIIHELYDLVTQKKKTRQTHMHDI